MYPLQCLWLWWDSDVPFDAIYLLHIRVWEAACSHSLPGPIQRLDPQTRGDSSSARPSHSNLAAEAWCLFLPHAMSWVSSITTGLCKQEVIKSAYSPGRRLINSTFSARRGAETHTGSINPSLASILSLRMSVFFFFLFFFSFLSKRR